jgi:shikimate dehydrogenase
VAVALLQQGVSEVHVANRTPERARELARALGERVHPLPLEEGAIRALAPRVSLVVNCTSLGMHPHPELSPWEDFTLFSPATVVADVVYNPRRTLFLQRAGEAGLKTVDGTGMLVHQAAAAWRHWFGQPGPVEVFREVVESCLP